MILPYAVQDGHCCVVVRNMAVLRRQNKMKKGKKYAHYSTISYHSARPGLISLGGSVRYSLLFYHDI
jgi:hypothetical protein